MTLVLQVSSWYGCFVGSVVITSGKAGGWIVSPSRAKHQEPPKAAEHTGPQGRLAMFGLIMQAHLLTCTITDAPSAL